MIRHADSAKFRTCSDMTRSFCVSVYNIVISEADSIKALSSTCIGYRSLKSGSRFALSMRTVPKY